VRCGDGFAKYVAEDWTHDGRREKRTTVEKGNALEQAVGAIESAILSIEPAAKENHSR